MTVVRYPESRLRVCDGIVPVAGLESWKSRLCVVSLFLFIYPSEEVIICLIESVCNILYDKRMDIPEFRESFLYPGYFILL